MRNILITILSLLLLSACREDTQKDFFLSGEGIKIRRYDRLQYEASAMSSVTAMQKMNMEYPHATKILIEDVLALGHVDSEKINDKLCAYYSDSSLVNLMLDVEEKYKDLSKYEKELTEGFIMLKKEIPSLPIPLVYAQISALNQSIVVGDSLLGISLDKYMGEDYPMYKKYYYGYQRKTMTPERIVPDGLSFYLYSLFPFGWEDNHRTLFDILMYRGKISWVVEKAMKSKILGKKTLGYTDKDLDWCEENKMAFISWMKEKRHFSSTDPMVIKSYVLPLPGSIFKKTVPPMIGVWIGMQLVDDYMSEHPEITIKQLLDMNDFRTVLDNIKIKDF